MVKQQCKTCSQRFYGKTKVIQCSSCKVCFRIRCASVSKEVLNAVETGSASWRCKYCPPVDESIIVMGDDNNVLRLLPEEINLQDNASILNYIKKLVQIVNEDHRSQTFMSEQIDDLLKQNEKIMNENSELKSKVNSMERQINKMENMINVKQQEENKSDIIMAGLPANISDPLDTFKKIGQLLQPDFAEENIISVTEIVRLEEYKRLATVGKIFDIENYILNASETKKIFPLLNENSFIGSLFSPGDGVVDPTMLCTALKKAAVDNGATVIENCNVIDFLISNELYNWKNLEGVKTTYGDIKTNIVINATGVWGCDLVKKYGSVLPLVPMKHSYIVTESIKGVRGLPNIRDHDFSIYFRIQGDSICMGGYEANPTVLNYVSQDFKFGLYDLDWSIFETHIEKAIDLCHAFRKIGIASSICGPESFTPDHKPLMGPDPNIKGLYHSCGYNSAGMMFGGGCGEQIALWALNGKPDLPMFQFDLRRFTGKQVLNNRWVTERSHESYVKNYSIVFAHDQPLGGRNISLDPLHNVMLEHNAFMEEKQGWERPAFFMTSRVDVLPYDWYGSYKYKRNSNSRYETCLNEDLKYEFSKYHNLIGREALACRKNAVLFNMSYFGKMYLEGPEAEQAAEWLFTSNINQQNKKVIYTCALNNAGGVEADLTISRETENFFLPNSTNFSNPCFYIVCGGASAHYTYHFLRTEIKLKEFKANLRNVTEDFGIISIQGPNSRSMIQKIVDIDLSDESFPQNTKFLANVVIGKVNRSVKIMRVSFVGELGYEFHVPKHYCTEIYQHLFKSFKSDDLINAGYRALYSLSSEKGYHLWGSDLRSTDTPVEANLLFTCKKKKSYNGKKTVDKQRKKGIKKKLVYLTLKERLPLWGLEGLYRNGEPVGFLRRGEYAYSLDKSLGQAYVERDNENSINDDYIVAGFYEIDIMGKMHQADCYLQSPFNLNN